MAKSCMAHGNTCTHICTHVCAHVHSRVCTHARTRVYAHVHELPTRMPSHISQCTCLHTHVATVLTIHISIHVHALSIHALDTLPPFRQPMSNFVNQHPILHCKSQFVHHRPNWANRISVESDQNRRMIPHRFVDSFEKIAFPELHGRAYRNGGCICVHAHWLDSYFVNVSNGLSIYSNGLSTCRSMFVPY